MTTDNRRKKSRTHASSIRKFVEGELREAIRADGGDVAFEGMDGHTVRVRMGALCSLCPSAPRTAKHFVERRLREKFSADIIVEARIVRPYFWEGRDWSI